MCSVCVFMCMYSSYLSNFYKEDDIAEVAQEADDDNIFSLEQTDFLCESGNMVSRCV